MDDPQRCQILPLGEGVERYRSLYLPERPTSLVEDYLAMLQQHRRARANPLRTSNVTTSPSLSESGRHSCTASLGWVGKRNRPKSHLPAITWDHVFGG